MKKFFITAAVSVISLASLLAVPSVADECKQDCQKEKCAQKVCAEKACAKEDCAKQECCKKEKCGKKCQDGRKAHRHHCAKAKHSPRCHAAPNLGDHAAAYFELTKAQQIQVRPIIKDYESQLKSPQEERREDFESVLTDKQKQEIKSAEPGKAPRIELSDAQKTKLKGLQQARMKEHKDKFDALKEQLKPILTSEQQAKLEGFRPPVPPVEPHHGPRDMQPSCVPGPFECGGPVPHLKFAPCFGGPMAKELNLTKEQQDKLKAISEKYDKRFKESAERARKEFTDNREAMKKEIDGVLTAEQKAKLEEKCKNAPHHRMGKPGKPHHHKPAKQLRNEKKHPKQCTKACKCEDKSLCKEAKCTEDCQKIKIVKKDKK